MVVEGERARGPLIVGLRRLSHGVPKIMSNPDKEVT